MNKNKINEIDDIIASVNRAFEGKKLDRTKHIDEISECLTVLGKNDMRVGQAFENIRNKYGNDLFNIENDKLLALFNELITQYNK
jgi:hypothetical protein